MIYAQIRRDRVENIIELKDPKLQVEFLKGFDYLIDITDVNPQPAIGWEYNGRSFSKAPEQVAKEEKQAEDVTAEKERQSKIEMIKSIDTTKVQDPAVADAIELLKQVLL